jgi:hypothetical protein
MTTQWRRFGWQQLELLAPAAWHLSKVSSERANGELWLADDALPRVQIKWLDATREKSVNPAETLAAYLKGIEKAAKKQRLGWECQRDLKILGRRAGVSSLEGFHWCSELEAFGVIWYNPDSQRVTLAQVNGRPGEPQLKALAKQVLGSLRDAPVGADDLWTAYSLETRIPRSFELAQQTTNTGHTELAFTRGRHGEQLAVARFGLAEIALKRAGDLGDWAWQQRYKLWCKYGLERCEATVGGLPAVAFRGQRSRLLERARWRAAAFLRQRYALNLGALVWHSAEANALFIVEHQHDPRDPDLTTAVSEQTPCQPTLLDPPKG